MLSRWARIATAIGEDMRSLIVTDRPIPRDEWDCATCMRLRRARWLFFHYKWISVGLFVGLLSSPNAFMLRPPNLVTMAKQY